jgi:hypothetical protein
LVVGQRVVLRFLKVQLYLCCFEVEYIIAHVFAPFGG